MTAHPSRDDLTAYALGALDPGEERAVADHVGDCERCAAELRHLAPAVGVLAESVEQYQPPPELGQRLMEIVREEAAPEYRAAPAARRSRGRARFDFRHFFLRPVAGLATIALLAAGVAGYLVADDGDSPRTETIAFEATMPGSGASLELADDSATLHVHGMPALADGGVYQVWVNDGSATTPSAAFVPHEDGTATAAVPEAVGGAKAVMVTQESQPGRPTPNLPSILTAKLD